MGRSEMVLICEMFCLAAILTTDILSKMVKSLIKPASKKQQCTMQLVQIYNVRH